MINSRFFKFALGFLGIIAVSGVFMLVVIPLVEDNHSVEVDEDSLMAESDICDPTLEVC